MDNQSPNEPTHQTAKSGRNTTQVGRDYTNTKTTNFNFVFLIVGVLALGGLAWGLYIGQTNNPEVNPIPTHSSQTSPSPTAKP